MLLICGFAVDFNFFTANPQTKILSPQFADLRTCGPVCGSAQHWWKCAIATVVLSNADACACARTYQCETV